MQNAHLKGTDSVLVVVWNEAVDYLYLCERLCVSATVTLPAKIFLILWIRVKIRLNIKTTEILNLCRKGESRS